MTAGARPAREAGPPRALRPPQLVVELALIALSYGAYTLIRNAIPSREILAHRNAHHIWAIEQRWGIAVERTINHAFDQTTWLIVPINYYYATLHFSVTLIVLTWLFHRHPYRFAAARTVLLVATALALIGFALYPLAPPRLMIDGGFIDTVIAHRTWGSWGSPSTSSVSNQFAAMPSMHFGWSLWCGWVVTTVARPIWLKIAGLAYPPATLLVIVATANHFWLDAVGGALCILVGIFTARHIHRERALRLAPGPPVTGTCRDDLDAEKPWSTDISA